MESLTLGYLAASLRNNSIDVDLIDAQLFCLSEEDTIKRSLTKPYSLIGVSISAQRTYSTGVRLIKGLRAAGVRAHIVIGGMFATFAHDRILQEVPEIDSVIRGEADYSIVHLVQTVLAGGPLNEVRGLTFRRKSHNGGPSAEERLSLTGNGIGSDIVVNLDADQICDLDALPLAARDNLPDMVHEVLAGERAVGMLAGRGCEAKCSFCSVPPFVKEQGRRFRSPANVVAEMELLRREWGIRYFRFYDDTLIGRGHKYTAWLEEFCKLLIERLPGIEFEAMGVRADGVSERLFKKLYAAGLRKVFVGLDTGSRSRLRNYQKPQTLSSSEKTVAILKDLGIEANYGFIMFQPTTVVSEVRENLIFLQKIENYGVHNLVNRFNVFYGVPVDEMVIRERLIRGPNELDSRWHYEFADQGVRELHDLLEIVAKELSQVRVIGANLELYLIELRVALYCQKAKSVASEQRVVKACTKLELETKEIIEQEKAIWTRLFNHALTLVEKRTDIETAQEEVKKLAERERRMLAREIEAIETIMDELQSYQTAAKTGDRSEEIHGLCRAFVRGTAVAPILKGGATITRPNWSPMRTASQSTRFREEE